MSLSSQTFLPAERCDSAGAGRGCFRVVERSQASEPAYAKGGPTLDLPNGPIEEPNMAFSLSSPAFSNGQAIPAKYTCDAENLRPNGIGRHLYRPVKQRPTMATPLSAPLGFVMK